MVLPYIIPPKRLIGRKIAGSSIFLSSFKASSRAQNRIPSTIARTPVFFPGVARLSNSCVENSFASTEKIASLTREHLTTVQVAGVRPESAHSLIPCGALIEVALAASRKCSEIMLIVHSFVATRFARVSFALEKPPANPMVKSGGSWLITCV